MLQLNTLVRFIHSHSPARLSKFKKILARRPKSVPTPALDPKLTFSQHINITIINAKQTLNSLKTLTSTKWGKQKKLIVSTFEAIQSYYLPHFRICKHHMEPHHIKHQHQETANHSKHSFTNCYCLYTRYKR